MPFRVQLHIMDFMRALRNVNSALEHTTEAIGRINMPANNREDTIAALRRAIEEETRRRITGTPPVLPPIVQNDQISAEDIRRLRGMTMPPMRFHTLSDAEVARKLAANYMKKHATEEELPVREVVIDDKLRVENERLRKLIVDVVQQLPDDLWQHLTSDVEIALGDVFDNAPDEWKG